MLEGSCHCGQVRWTYDRVPESATACSCTVCRRYGALWAYDFDNEGIHIEGESRVYSRGEDPWIGFHFCPVCGCVICWRALKANDEGRRRSAVNLRLADPAQVGSVVVRHFDGLNGVKDLPPDGRCVSDMWF
jgi:hypothetical protein